MKPCLRRQKLITRTPEGEATSFQCVNRNSPAFAQTVNEDICAGCPFIKEPTEPPPCQDKPPAPPPLPPSEQKPVDVEVKELIKGTVLEDMPIDGLEKADKDSPEYPAISMQLWLYKEALGRWKKAGYPVRTDEEVREIHATKCKNCSWFDAEKSRCKGCGCKVSVGSVAIFNKIKMATEHCPKGEW